MTPGARAQAAIEILEAMARSRAPAAAAIKEWSAASRFAGAKDRSAVSALVYDALRKRRSLAFAMDDEGPRALVLAVLRWVWGLSGDEIAASCDGERHNAPPPDAGESARLALETPWADAPPDVAADIPEFLWPQFEAQFGAAAVAEGQALAARAPTDLRVNMLKRQRDQALNDLSFLHPKPAVFSPVGVRIAPPQRGERAPAVEAEPAHAKGWIEVQDEGSQLAALLTGARPGMQAADLCAGAGGKTLVLAALMENKGQIFAYDIDHQRLAKAPPRLQRAGVRNVQILDPRADRPLERLADSMDLVLIDAPCSGSGTWRKRPDAKWRLAPDQLTQRQRDQGEALALGAPLVKPGGRLAFVTCSVLPSENQERLEAFLAAHPQFAPVPFERLATAALGEAGRTLVKASYPAGPGRLLTPAKTGTDGFFIGVMERAA